jgi:hypothetical protein
MMLSEHLQDLVLDSPGIADFLQEIARVVTDVVPGDIGQGYE